MKKLIILAIIFGLPLFALNVSAQVETGKEKTEQKAMQKQEKQMAKQQKQLQKQENQ